MIRCCQRGQDVDKVCQCRNDLLQRLMKSIGVRNYLFKWSRTSKNPICTGIRARLMSVSVHIKDFSDFAEGWNIQRSLTIFEPVIHTVWLWSFDVRRSPIHSLSVWHKVDSNAHAAVLHSIDMPFVVIDVFLRVDTRWWWSSLSTQWTDNGTVPR